MLVSAIVLGFMGSLHCVGMCGPIAFLLPVDHNKPVKKVFQTALYHFGRLMAYAIMGLLFGLLGRGLYVFGIQQNLSILVGAAMILIILLPQRILQKSNLSKPFYRLIAKVKNKLGKELKRKSPDTFLTIGFLNGFLPCGLVYMALLGAVAMGTPLQGSLYMLLFGVGTIPLMTTAIYLSRFLTNATKRTFQKAIPALVILMGVLFIVRGLGLGIPYLSPKVPVSTMATSPIECHP